MQLVDSTKIHCDTSCNKFWSFLFLKHVHDQLPILIVQKGQCEIAGCPGVPVAEGSPEPLKVTAFTNKFKPNQRFDPSLLMDFVKLNSTCFHGVYSSKHPFAL